jgi:hypothetical protein
MVSNSVLVTVWLSVGVLGVVAGLLWLRGVERTRRTASEAVVPLSRPATSAATHDAHEPDALAG